MHIFLSELRKEVHLSPVAYPEFLAGMRGVYSGVARNGGKKQWRRSVVNLGGPGHLSPSFNLPFFPSLSWTPHEVWAESANPLPDILMQFMQSNSLIKFTLMFNVLSLPGSLQKSATVGRNDTRLWITSLYRPCIAAWHWQ